MHATPRVLALLLLVAAATAGVPGASAAPDSCSASSPNVVGTTGVTAVVGVPTCTGYASCSGCVGMTLRVSIVGTGLVSADMDHAGFQGPSCVGVNACSASMFLAAVGIPFTCRGSGTVPTVALEVTVTCSVG